MAKTKSSKKGSSKGSDDFEYVTSYDFEDCNWEGAINFSPGLVGTFGYLLSFNGCGGINLKQDLTLENPFTSQGQSEAVLYDDGSGPVLKCAGVIEKFLYLNKDENKAAAIRISALVSGKSAADIHNVLSKTDKKTTDVEVGWYIIACEGAGEDWYEAAHVMEFANAMAAINTEDSKGTDTTTGTNKSAAGKLRISIDRECADCTQELSDIDIRLYRFNFEIVPAPGQVNELHFATGLLEPVVVEWGKSG